MDLVADCRAANPPAPTLREVELGPPVGRILRAHAVALPVAGQGAGAVLVLHDVTELRRLERVRAEFVANVSHELRTPLTAITGYLETLADGALDDPAHARQFVETAHAHAWRLGRLVDDLLQLSNVESGQLVLALEPLALRDVAAGVVTMFEQPAAEKRLRLENGVAGDVRVRADRDRLVQVLINLVDNAVKYTPEAGRVAIAAARRPDGLVEVSVTDTGIGIPSTDLPRLSERFYRVDRARSRALGGTGLGLSIVKHLIHAHRGELRIDSELGKGTTVRFTLPAA
jgi:two-component system phosphate regulon sensor histidine kinase PhoR